MQQQPLQSHTVPPKIIDEHILVVKRDILFPTTAWNGLMTDNFDYYVAVVQQHKEFYPRSLMEQDPTYKQIIPYLIFTHNNHYFLMQRHKKASEQRLHSKLSLGIGGHVRQEDLEGTTLFDWARREFHEEVTYAGNLTIRPIGLLNDDSNEVGKVHLGFVLLLAGDSPEITIKSELAHGSLVSLQECAAGYDRMETWSQFVLTTLLKEENQSS